MATLTVDPDGTRHYRKVQPSQARSIGSAIGVSGVILVLLVGAFPGSILVNLLLGGYNAHLTVSENIVLLVCVFALEVVYWGITALSSRPETAPEDRGPPKAMAFDVMYQWLDDKTMLALCADFVRTKVGDDLPPVIHVYNAQRKHVLGLIFAPLPYVLGGVLALGYGIFEGVTGALPFGLSSRDLGWSHATYTLSLIYGLVGVVLLFRALMIVVRWFTDFFVIREFTIERWRHPPTWLPWLEAENATIADHNNVLFLEVRKGFWGRLFQTGVLGVDSASQADERAFRRQHWVRRPNLTRRIILDAKERINVQVNRQSRTAIRPKYRDQLRFDGG